ncbi:MAG: NAD(P)H-dependent oxidoreductase subunit E [Alphaproteobacteria bacterium]
MKKSGKSLAPAPFDADEVRRLAEGLKALDGALLPILHAINDRFGHVDARAAPIVADVLNLTRAEVHGVLTFYHDFRRAPPPRHVVRLCRAEACQAMGADALHSELEKSCAGAAVLVEAVYCLGNCALSPAALIDGKLYGRLDAAKVLELARR